MLIQLIIFSGILKKAITHKTSKHQKKKYIYIGYRFFFKTDIRYIGRSLIQSSCVVWLHLCKQRRSKVCFLKSLVLTVAAFIW